MLDSYLLSCSDSCHILQSRLNRCCVHYTGSLKHSMGVVSLKTLTEPYNRVVYIAFKQLNDDSITSEQFHSLNDVLNYHTDKGQHHPPGQSTKYHWLIGHILRSGIWWLVWLTGPEAPPSTHRPIPVLLGSLHHPHNGFDWQSLQEWRSEHRVAIRRHRLHIFNLTQHFSDDYFDHQPIYCISRTFFCQKL